MDSLCMALYYAAFVDGYIEGNSFSGVKRRNLRDVVGFSKSDFSVK